MEKLSFEEFALMYYTKDKLLPYRYIRKSDGYICYSDDVDSAREYFNKRGKL